MTGRWLTVSQTITRIYNATGRLLTAEDVLRLALRSGPDGLVVAESHEHTRVLEQSVLDYIAERARRPVPRDPANPAESLMTAADEDEFQRGKEADL